WERGAGITEACGTGACAAAWAANRWELVGNKVEVEMPGGTAIVEMADEGGGPGEGHAVVGHLHDGGPARHLDFALVEVSYS
ncbi:MAG: hypothetical protein AAFN30_09390, partial [Actinomycetota bacterium]